MKGFEPSVSSVTGRRIRPLCYDSPVAENRLTAATSLPGEAERTPTPQEGSVICPLSILVVRHVAHGGYPDLVGVIQLVPPVGIEPTCALTHLFYRQASLPAGARRP